MNPHFDPAAFQQGINRRTFLGRSAYGLGGLALAGLLEPNLFADAPRSPARDRWRGVVNPPHHPVKAKRIIHLCMAGGPSQFESFDFKPDLKPIKIPESGKPAPVASFPFWSRAPSPTAKTPRATHHPP